MAFTFIKLMVVDFGWEEIPHIYPIGGVLSIIFSNQLSSDFQKVEEVELRLARHGETGKRIAFVLGFSILRPSSRCSRRFISSASSTGTGM